MDGHVYGPSAGRQTEQCLALDVYATLPPPPRDRLKPVVVFLYGGSLIAVGLMCRVARMSNAALFVSCLLGCGHAHAFG